MTMADTSAISPSPLRLDPLSELVSFGLGEVRGVHQIARWFIGA
jgi:hypothetical protein